MLSIDTARLRLCPEYSLAATGSLPDVALEMPGDAGTEGLEWAVVRDSNVPVTLVSSEVEVLLRTIGREDSPAAAPGTDVHRTLATLLLDGLLSVDGISGPAAHDQVFSGSDTHRDIGNLTILALRAAQVSATDHAGLLADRMYRFFGQPATPEWRARFPDPDAVETFVREGIRAKTSTTLAECWKRAETSPEDPWLTWDHRRGARRDREASVYKLYVNAPWQQIPACLDALVPALTQNSAYAFKIPRRPENLLRPDKIVVYTNSLFDVRQIASELRPSPVGHLLGVVPFALPLRSAPLSWGMDPPRVATGGTGKSTSWRQWITRRLATYSRSARLAALEEPWRFALDRLRLDGVDLLEGNVEQAVWLQQHDTDGS